MILDEWIVREVIDTLYMARTTFLGITGLDSPQEVAKKSANETAITRRISQAIDIIQQSKKQSMPESLEEAAEEWCKENNKGIALSADKKSHYLAEGVDAFKAGAEWQKKMMMREAVEGFYTKSIDGDVVFAESTALDVNPKSVKVGDKVKLIVIKEDEK